MEFLAPSGSGLSISERAGLDIAMLQVRQSENLPLGSLSFWGRIKGKNDDYLVAVALTPSYPFPSKKFYYTTTAKSEKMSQMPDLSEEYAAHAATLVSKPFAGEPSMPYPIPPKEGEEEVVAEPVLDENGEEIQPEVFREEHKLAYHVIKNPAYEGLAYEAAGQLRSYFHFRAPKSERAQKALEKPGVVRSGDFLDPIADDVPAGTFSLYYDPSNTMAIIRSFYWPGAYFYHQIGTGNYGSVYMGDGLPNTDIQFML
ncbi:hypothetical protein JL722_13990 [Aureococcus anophagefferens]|nr:hypothetical protein JL722_13990 [Aureococcus anophagefferens]